MTDAADGNEVDPAEFPEFDIDFDALEELTHPLAQDLLFAPDAWSVWPAVAVLRWLLRSNRGMDQGLIYRSHPSLAFSAAEIKEVELLANSVQLTLAAPGLASHGSALPAVDIARIAADARSPGGGALAHWLDGPLDRFMQAVEVARARHNNAFALASGTRLPDAHQRTTELVGKSAPLAADRNGRLADSLDRHPEGALGLAAAFVGTPSATGLANAVAGYTGLPARIDEFAGASVRIQRPARMGGSLTSILGKRCDLAVAGVDVVIDGGNSPEGAELARQRTRRFALHDLCAAYIGSPSIQARLHVELEPSVIVPAQLGFAEFGGLAVLGRSSERLRLPLPI